MSDHSTRTLDVATSSVRDIRKALRAAGAKVVAEHVTPGAVGYTTITIGSASR